MKINVKINISNNSHLFYSSEYKRYSRRAPLSARNYRRFSRADYSERNQRHATTANQELTRGCSPVSSSRLRGYACESEIRSDKADTLLRELIYGDGHPWIINISLFDVIYKSQTFPKVQLKYKYI